MATRCLPIVYIAALILPTASIAETRAHIEVHYAPEENLESFDARELGRAELSIDMAAYVLSDRQIVEALISAAERDVVIRLYLEQPQFAEHGPVRGGAIEALLAHPNVAAGIKARASECI